MPPKKKKRKPRSRARGSSAAPLAAQPDQASEERRRERLEARREAKAKAVVAARRRQRIERVFRLTAIFAALAAVIWFVFIRGGAPDAIAGYDVKSFDLFISESRAGTLHRAQGATYESSPPVSGPHAPSAVPCGTYGQQIPTEQMIHTLEHGGAGVLFSPGADIKDIRAAEALVESYDSHVFSAPFAEMESEFTMVAWGYLMETDSFDESATKEFIDAFRAGGDAPESNQPCDMTADQPFQAPTESPAAEETPHVDETPHEEETPTGKDKKNE